MSYNFALQQNWPPKCKCIHPSIHCLSLIWDWTPGWPRPHGTYNPSSMFWVYHRVPSQSGMSRIPPREGVQGATSSDNQTTSAGSFRTQRSSSCTLSSLLMAKHLPLYLRLSPTALRWKLIFGHLKPESHSFGHYLKLITIGEGWNIDLKVNWALTFWLSPLFTTAVCYNACITTDAAPNHLSTSHSIFPSLVNKIQWEVDSLLNPAAPVHMFHHIRIEHKRQESKTHWVCVGVCAENVNTA